jgi:hypothetical protein
VRTEFGLHESLPLRQGHTIEAGALEATSIVGDSVVPIAISPSPDPTDETVYVLLDSIRDDGSLKHAYVQRYFLHAQSVSGQQRYRLSTAQGGMMSTLTIHLVATISLTPEQRAADATELTHTQTIQLEFLAKPSERMRKTLDLTDVTRNGQIVTAALTFGP